MGSIGIFDSGLGGIQTLQTFVKQLPQYDYLYLGDTAYAPYGTKDPQTIQERTFFCLQRLFDHGASIVIIACNTAAAVSVRARQTQYPQYKVLSVSIPAIEYCVAQSYRHIGVLATVRTVQSGIYPELFRRFGADQSVAISCVAAQDLVTMIEGGIDDPVSITTVISQYLQQLPSDCEVLILGCTHFPLYGSYVASLFPGVVLDPAREAVRQFVPYLERHPDIGGVLTTMGSRRYFVTGDPSVFLVKAKAIDQRIDCVEQVKGSDNFQH